MNRVICAGSIPFRLHSGNLEILLVRSFGKNYWAGYLRKYKAKGNVQEAHEAIRPTYADRKPESLTSIDPRQLKLYTLIWQRFIACQMSSAIFDSVLADILERAKVKAE